MTDNEQVFKSQASCCTASRSFFYLVNRVNERKNEFGSALKRMLQLFMYQWFHRKEQITRTSDNTGHNG